MTSQEYIRNFCILAHIDHGKSTLADRFLELTGTVEQRKMREQYLDQMDLERERGITIKMQPVRMLYNMKSLSSNLESRNNTKIQNSKNENADALEIRDSKLEIAGSKEYVLNLIDTPGHVDFSYEVSRALAAVEGAILLVDGARGIQAQTVANLEAAQREGLVIIPAVNKIDLAQARTDAVAREIADLLGIDAAEVYRVSAKDGTGAEALLDAAVEKIPAPRGKSNVPLRALIFDSYFDAFRGVIVHLRVVDGEVIPRMPILLAAKRVSLEVLEVGYFIPEEKKSDKLSCGEIGWMATGIKDPDTVRVGDTVTSVNRKLENKKIRKPETTNFPTSQFHSFSSAVEPLPGYAESQPVVFASLFPGSEDEFEKLRDALKNVSKS